MRYFVTAVIATTLAAALLASSVHAGNLKGEEIEARTYRGGGGFYDPHTYTQTFTADDEAVAARSPRRWLPPDEYDYPYPGSLRIIEISTREEMERHCPPPPGLFRIACARRDGNSCTIFHPPEDVIKRGNLTLNIVMRHEIGHCNGWPQDHRGAR